MNELLGQKVEVKINNNVVLSGTIVYVEKNEDEHEVVVEENVSKRQYIVQFPISN